MPFNVGPVELIIVLAIALLIVGPGKLPEMGSAIGRTIKEFRNASSDITDAVKVETTQAAPAQAQPNTLSIESTPNATAAATPAAAAGTPAPAAPDAVAAPATGPATDAATEGKKADAAEQA